MKLKYLAALIPILVLIAPVAYAFYQSGFKYGVSDARIASQGSSNWYILQPVCNNPLLRSYISQSCDVLVTPDKNALTSKGKVALEGIWCRRGPSIVMTLELFYGTIPQKLKNDLGVACGWH